MGKYQKIIEELDRIDKITDEVEQISIKMNYRIKNNIYKLSSMNDFLKRIDYNGMNDFFMELLDTRPKTARDILNLTYGFNQIFPSNDLIKKCMSILIQNDSNYLRGIVIKQKLIFNKAKIIHIVENNFEFFNIFNTNELMQLSLRSSNKSIMLLTFEKIKNIKNIKAEKLDVDMFNEFKGMLSNEQKEELKGITMFLQLNKQEDN